MSAIEPSGLALFWAGVIAVAILVYVVLDGFDLGVGILFGTNRDAALREQMMAAISPFWDGNETWLVVIGASLFGAFPLVYAVFLPAFYIPALLLLFGLIFRGVAFEFRNAGARGLWDWGFFVGSTVAAFVQGAAVGAMIGGIPVVNNQYAGGSLEWLRPLPVLTGIGLVLGYALLGAGWLTLKSEGELRDWAWRRIPWLAGAVLVVLGVAVVAAFIEQARVTGNLFLGRPWGLVFPVIGLLGIIRGLRWRAPAARRLAVRPDRGVLRSGASLACGDVLALYDSLFRHCRRRRGPRKIALLPVLGRRGFRIAGHRDLHRSRLLAVPRQAAQRIRMSCVRGGRTPGRDLGGKAARN